MFDCQKQKYSTNVCRKITRAACHRCYDTARTTRIGKRRIVPLLFFFFLFCLQRAVHAAIKEEMPRIHAITLKCKTPEQYQRLSE